MLSKVLYLVCTLVFVSGLYDGEVGDICEQAHAIGKCVLLKNCKSALNDMKNRKTPKICGFSGTDPIVCCFDNSPTSSVTEAPKPVATTKRPVSSTTEYNPQGHDYEFLGPSRFGTDCEPIDPSLTAPKTGRKAWDKCIEYQEKFVYPCEPSVTLTAGMSEMIRAKNCHHDADELIVGGVDAAPNEFPHMAMIGLGEKPDVNWECGGSIISENFILTAGHCITNRDTGNATYIAVGVHTRADVRDESKIYRIRRVVRYPGYKPPSKYNDIALMETDRPIKLDQFTVPACLNIDSAVNDNRAIATGWGSTVSRKQNLSQVLQKVILTKFSTEECKQQLSDIRLMKHGFDAHTQLCYGDKTDSKDACQGDSGGPLQIKSRQLNCMYMIVGVTSSGKGCGIVGYPGIFTRVETYVPWIESVVWP